MEIQGLDKFAKTLNNAQDNYKKEAKKLLNEIGMKLKTRVVLKTPVDSGVLKKGWRSKKEGDLARIVYNNVKYGPHVEYGHRTKGGKSFVDGRYMLTKSVKEIESDMEKEFSIMIDNLWK